jgi:hypothetical protein
MPNPLPNKFNSLERKNHWSFPPQGFAKLNFDGDSKGNSSPTRFGVEIRDAQG